MKNYFAKYAHWSVLCIIFILVVLYYFFSAGYYGSTENITHFLYSKWAFQMPEFFIYPWARPLYTALSAPFAQLGFKWVQMLNVLLGMATAYYCYRIAKLLNIHPALPVIIFVCFTPMYFIMMPTALTEILFSFVLVFSCYLFLSGHYYASAIVISFLPFARSEGFFILFFYFLALLYVKKYKPIPLLAMGTLFFSLVGWYHYKDFFWVFTQFPYQVHHGLYNIHGELFHFVKYYDEIIGLPLAILFIIGTLQVLKEIFSRDRTLRNSSVILCLLSLFPFLFYLSLHSFLYWQALGASVGLTRVMAGVTPLAVIISLKGLAALFQYLRISKLLRNIISGVFVLLVIYSSFRLYPIPYQQSSEEETIFRASRWVKDSPYVNNLQFFTDLTTPYVLGINPFFNNPPKGKLIYECVWLNIIDEGSVVLWESRFGNNESKIPLDSIFSHPRMKLIKSFYPSNMAIPSGEKSYCCMVFITCSGNPRYDNYAIRDSLNDALVAEHRLKTLLLNSFDQSTDVGNTLLLSKDTVHHGKFSFRMDEKTTFSPGFSQQVKDLQIKQRDSSGQVIEAKGIDVVLYVYLLKPLKPSNSLLVMSVEHNNESYSYISLNLNGQKFKQNEWNRVFLSARLPEFQSPEDVIKIYVWNPDKQVFYMDEMQIFLTK